MCGKLYAELFGGTMIKLQHPKRIYIGFLFSDENLWCKICAVWGGRGERVQASVGHSSTTKKYFRQEFLPQPF